MKSDLGDGDTLLRVLIQHPLNQVLQVGVDLPGEFYPKRKKSKSKTKQTKNNNNKLDRILLIENNGLVKTCNVSTLKWHSPKNEAVQSDAHSPDINGLPVEFAHVS